MQNQLLFTTTTSLSTNPRLLKEIKLASDKGFDLAIVAFKLGNWSDKTDLEHIRTMNNPGVTYLSAIKKPFIPWILSTIVWKICNVLYPLFKNSIRLNAYAHNKRTWLIYRHLKKHKEQYNLIVAHNLGALYPAWIMAKKYKIPFAFDIEDYHPGEKCPLNEKKRREYLMKKLLPQATYITYASPLIGEYSFKLLGNNNNQGTAQTLGRRGQGERFLINNCFPQTEFQYKETNNNKIRFIWFSQNISAQRGLELVIPALARYKDQIELTLIGNLYQDFYNDFLLQYAGFIKIEKPLNQKELNLKLSEFDMGLAIELDSADFNRQICLTNKIFSYAQAGLYILASDTTAQKQFIEEHPQLGVTSGQTVTEMETQIGKIIKDIENIRSQKKNRFEYAKKLSWEVESRKLVEIWGKVLINI